MPDLSKNETFGDIHTHLDMSPTWDPRWDKPGLQKMRYHVERDRIDELWVIVRDPENYGRRYLPLEQRLADSCRVQSFYWIPNVASPNESVIGAAYSLGWVHGLKVHPRVDSFTLTAKAMLPVTRLARRLKLPIIFHTECETEAMHWVEPFGYEELIAKNSDIPFVIGHGGGYCLTRLHPATPPGKHFWRETKKPHAVGHLVQEALRITATYPNAFYDTSVSTNTGKAKRIADFINVRPETAKKVLIGTDYPIQMARCPTQVAALLKNGLRADLGIRIVHNRFSRILADWQW